jgi:hypothetical protein
MWFEKRPIVEASPREPLDEVRDLPPELNSLAEQLSHDADSLARCYPPRSAEQLVAIATELATTGSDWRSVKRIGILSGLCAATLLAVFVGWLAVDRFNHDGAVAEGHTLTVEQSGQVAQLNDANGLGQGSEPIGDQENFLKGLSGAEQEAVLDLIESHAMHKTSLSI